MQIRLKNPIIYVNILSIIAILVSEICFYTSDSVRLYFVTSFLGIFLSSFSLIKYINYIVIKKSFIKWIISIYFMFIIYGSFFIKADIFNLDIIFYRFIECIALYSSIFGIIKIGGLKKIYIPFLISGLISGIYLFLSERDMILLGSNRIGDSLSGNVNTIGYIFGLLSLIVIWSYCQKKSKIKLLSFFIFVAIMLASGSKKALIILLIDLVLLFYYDKKKISGMLKLILLVAILLFLIFSTDYFYNIIGIRIESMIYTLFNNSNTYMYSYSTDVRNNMIHEAFRLFLEKPVLGGGWNYYASKTVYGYTYSHCNYVEILCSFGIFGFLLYYSRYIFNFIYIFKGLKIENYKEDIILLISLLSVSIILDWAVVSFSSQSIWYIPIIISSAYIDIIRFNQDFNL